MEKYYVYKCTKCKKVIKNTFTVAKSKKEIGRSMDEKIMIHDLNSHRDDLEFPKGELLCLVQQKRSGKSKAK